MQEALAAAAAALHSLHGVDIDALLAPARGPRESGSGERERGEGASSAAAGTDRPPAAAAVSIVLIKWGTKYGPEYVNRLAAGLRRHHNTETVSSFRILCFTDCTDGVDESSVECRCDY
jgi:hypothetical protein